MSKAATSAQRLSELGLISKDEAAALKDVESKFSTRLSPEVLRQIKTASFDDPIFRQYVPSVEERTVRDDELADPIGDTPHQKVKGVIHRYPDRLLLTPTHTCQVYCRFCFRREKVGSALTLTKAELDAAYRYIDAHNEVHEVILTGGDPLVLSDRRLGEIIARLSAIPHITVLRIHTRVPLAQPERITSDLLKALKTKLALYMVIHVNHAAELSPAVCKSLARLVKSGVPLLSQSVLLKGVNNDASVLETLFRALIANRVTPYYLHHPDRAEGTSHFRVSVAEGQTIMRALRGRLSGLAQPTYVLDIPGGFGKVPVGPDFLKEEAPGQYEIAGPDGRQHRYQD